MEKAQQKLDFFDSLKCRLIFSTGILICSTIFEYLFSILIPCSKSILCIPGIG